MKIYGDALSGNCQKVRFTADHLGLTYEWVAISTLKNESRTPAYLAKFPQGQVPAIETDDGRCLAQSNAILRYLARGSHLLPDDPWTQAKIDEWLFWEQYSHEPYIAVCRFNMVYQGKSKQAREAWRVERGERALDLMERELAGRNWLASSTMTIADIALLAYTRLAPEGGFDLQDRPNLREWIARCEEKLGLDALTNDVTSSSG
ncbi:MAG TPA: glutathione S-transferase family protein [Pseudolabrys sp.]|nr:glutathione S-transferase family protein [Pseudolabrys sp.]